MSMLNTTGSSTQTQQKRAHKHKREGAHPKSDLQRRETGNQGGDQAWKREEARTSSDMKQHMSTTMWAEMEENNDG